MQTGCQGVLSVESMICADRAVWRVAILNDPVPELGMERPGRISLDLHHIELVEAAEQAEFRHVNVALGVEGDAMRRIRNTGTPLGRVGGVSPDFVGGCIAA